MKDIITSFEDLEKHIKDICFNLTEKPNFIESQVEIAISKNVFKYMLRDMPETAHLRSNDVIVYRAGQFTFILQLKELEQV